MKACRNHDVDRGSGRGFTLAALAAIVLVGLLLRVHRLDAESVWWDEYASVMHLDAPDLWAFLKLNRTLDPATFPLYCSIEYLWSHTVGRSMTGLRLVSVFFGLLALPVMYAVGRELYGRRAGLVAALCLALSPIHTFHARGIRTYALLALLALLSVYTFIKLVNDGRIRWWTAHFLVSFLLMWTHPFAPLLLAVEGLFLVAFRRCAWRVPATWVLGHGLLAAPSLLYLLTMAGFWSAEQTGAWLRVPSPLEFLGDVFADDVVNATYQLRASDRVMSALPGANGHGLDAALVGLLCGCVLGMAWWSWKTRNPKPETRNPKPSDASSWFVFLLLWVVAPPLTLYVASQVWRPCIFPRYTIYSSCGLYVLAGGAVAVLDRRWARMAAVLTLTALYAYQIALVSAEPQRTDWKAAAAQIEREGRPDDLVLVHSYDPALASASRDIFCFNAGVIANPVSFAKRKETLADQAAEFLRLCRDWSSADDRGRAVWTVMLLPYFTSGRDVEFETVLRARGLTFAMRVFSGIEYLLAYRVSSDAPVAIRTDVGRGQRPDDWVLAYGDLAIALLERGEYDKAKAVLQQTLEMKTDAEGLCGNLLQALEQGRLTPQHVAAVRALLRGYGFRYNQQNDFAMDQFRQACELDPALGVARHELATLLVETGDYDGALPLLREIVASDATAALVYGHLTKVVAAKGDAKRARDAINAFLEGASLSDRGEYEKMLAAFRKATEIDPEYALPYVAYGAMLLAKNDTEGCLEAMHKAFEVDPDVAAVWKPLVTALFETKQYDTAWAELNKLTGQGLDVPGPLIEKLQRESGRQR